MQPLYHPVLFANGRCSSMTSVLATIQRQVLQRLRLGKCEIEMGRTCFYATRCIAQDVAICSYMHPSTPSLDRRE